MLLVHPCPLVCYRRWGCRNFRWVHGATRRRDARVGPRAVQVCHAAFVASSRPVLLPWAVSNVSPTVFACPLLSMLYSGRGVSPVGLPTGSSPGGDPSGCANGAVGETPPFAKGSPPSLLLSALRVYRSIRAPSVADPCFLVCILSGSLRVVMVAVILSFSRVSLGRGWVCVAIVVFLTWATYLCRLGC